MYTVSSVNVCTRQTRPAHAIPDGHEERGDRPGPPDVHAERHERDGGDADLELEIGGQRDRRHDPHERPADDAAERHHEVEEREVPRARPPPRELAVAEHARDEEPRAEDRRLPEELELEALVDEEPDHHARGPGEAHEVEIGTVPVPALEAQDE